MTFVQNDNLLEWIELLLKENHLVAPKSDSGVILYKSIKAVEEIEWDYQKPVNSIKEVFFPPTETLFRIGENGTEVFFQEELPKEKHIVFGVRPCDVHGIRVLDAMFIEADPPDVNYAARREQAAIIGLACSEVGESCFCTNVGGAPDDSTGMDIMLTAVDGGFLVEVHTEKGQALIEELVFSGKEVVPPDIKIPNQIPIPDSDLLEQSFNSKLWGNFAEICLSCRICAYICPTCRCFDVRDEVTSGTNGGSKNKRIRCWDSCASEAYRKIAGGHNPREMKSDRLRNRVLCKLHYYQEQYGVMACTGCGRCIDACPVHIDITEIMGALLEEKQL